MSTEYFRNLPKSLRFATILESLDLTIEDIVDEGMINIPKEAAQKMPYHDSFRQSVGTGRYYVKFLWVEELDWKAFRIKQEIGGNKETVRYRPDMNMDGAKELRVLGGDARDTLMSIMFNNESIMKVLKEPTYRNWDGDKVQVMKIEGKHNRKVTLIKRDRLDYYEETPPGVFDKDQSQYVYEEWDDLDRILSPEGRP